MAELEEHKHELEEHKHAMTEARSGVLEALSDDVLRELCCYLPGRDLAAAGMCSRGFESRVGGCAHLWRELCVSLLGEARVALHKDAWGEAEATAAFYRRLFDAALKCAAFRYEADLRQTCAVTPIGGASARPAAEADRSLALLVCSTGHTAVALGGVVLQIGGWRRPASCDDVRELLKTNRDRRTS